MSDVLATLGQRLKAEREKKGLSAQKAADELNLDGWVVDAMESGDYARVGPAVYAKGHLKRYAVLLGLPVTEILEAYETQSSPPSPMSQPSTVRMRTSAPTGSELPWIQIVGFAVLALVVGGVMWWKPWHFFGAAGADPGERRSVRGGSRGQQRRRRIRSICCRRHAGRAEHGCPEWRGGNEHGWNERGGNERGAECCGGSERAGACGRTQQRGVWHCAGGGAGAAALEFLRRLVGGCA
jgi:transcriptional regulator with XRE-family HTH domain